MRSIFFFPRLMLRFMLLLPTTEGLALILILICLKLVLFECCDMLLGFSPTLLNSLNCNDSNTIILYTDHQNSFHPPTDRKF